jgi:cell division protease FtsH
MYAQEDIGITFDDVAGIDEAVEELREVVEFLKSPEKFQRLGARIPKGVLLIGPPGTGKTLLAKAVAGEAGVPFFSLSGSDFVEMFVGVGAARVRDMFQQAEAKSPCIIFIDELDALGKTRGSSVVGGHDEREQTLNALLVEMDGFIANNGVIVLAATNRPETLDPALLRPGRFDRHVVVDKPDVRGRDKILQVHVHNVKLDETVRLTDVAKITSGFVGADLANLVNEAALLAARKAKSAVGMDEFNEGVDRVTAGLEKKQRVMQVEEKQRIAYHEAGHALVAYSLPNTDPVHRVSIIPRGIGALGYVMRRPEQDRYIMTQGELESHIKVCLAGTLTEEMIFADVSTGAQNDLERASDIARAMVMDFGMSQMGRVNYRESTRSPFLAGSGDGGREHSFSESTARAIDEEVKRIIDESIDSVKHILTTRRAALVAVADKLLDKEVLDGAELKVIVDAASPGPLVVPGTETSRRTGAVAAALDIMPTEIPPTQAGERPQVQI